MFILQLPRFRIVQQVTGHIHAEFLVTVSVRGKTFGVWKRYSDFEKLYKKVRIFIIINNFL